MLLCSTMVSAGYYADRKEYTPTPPFTILAGLTAMFL
jgi:hypothetical protein